MIAQAAAAPPVTTRRSPYQGLVPYTDADAEWFFGRDEWQEIVRASLRSYRITVLYGASGVGKTSLLRAGLMRRLDDEAHGRDGGPRVLPVYFSAWSLDRPLAAVEHAVSDAAAKSGSAPTEGNAGPTLADALAAWSRRMEGALLVVLDQLEELFVYHDRPDDPILKELAAALSSRDPAIHFLLSIREDALAMLDRFKGHVPGLLDHLLRIEHLDRAAGREAIVAPLERWNEVLAAPGQPIEIEEALVESVLDQVEAGKVSLGEGGTGAVVGDSHPVGVEAPYLQLVLERIWDEERSHESETLRQQTFDRLGGATAVVRTHLDAALAALPSSEQDVAGATFRHLVTPSGTKIALRIADLAEYAGLEPEQVRPLVDRLARDVRILRSAGDNRYEIYHDALARPILDWNARWEEREKQRRERRRIRILGSIAGALIIVAAAVAALAIWALAQRGEARKQQDIALSGSLAGDAANQMASRPDLGILLGLEAYATRRTGAARDAVVRAVQRSDGVAGILFSDHAQIAVIALSPDERIMAVTGSEAGYASDITLLDVRRLDHPGSSGRAHE